MNEEAILNLLRTIHLHKLVGASPIEALTFAIEKGLVERTEIGNLILSEKGLDFIKGYVKWEDID